MAYIEYKLVDAVEAPRGKIVGILEFALSGNIVSGYPALDKWMTAPYQITNKGLRNEINYVTVP